MKGLTNALSKDVCVASATSQQGLVNSSVTAWKRKRLLPLLGGPLFLYACVVPFSCQRPLGVSAYFNSFLFLIQLFFFSNLFIPYTYMLYIDLWPSRQSEIFLNRTHLGKSAEVVTWLIGSHRRYEMIYEDASWGSESVGVSEGQSQCQQQW